MTSNDYVRVDKAAVFSVHKRSIIAYRKFELFDTYRIFERHCAVLPEIAWLSCTLFQNN